MGIRLYSYLQKNETYWPKLKKTLVTAQYPELYFFKYVFVKFPLLGTHELCVYLNGLNDL